MQFSGSYYIGGDMSNVFFLHAPERAPAQRMPGRAREETMDAKKLEIAEKKERKVTQCGKVIGENLQRILDREGVSQSELARKMNTQPGVINEICNGKRNVSVDRLDKIRAILGVDCYEFLMPTVKPE